MFVLGLTGSIGMGKTTAAAAFRRLGVPVHDADAAVHRQMAPGGQAVAAIAKYFPDCIVNGRIDRRALGARVFDDSPALKMLEGILHPLVRKTEDRFIRKHALQGNDMVVLDIPLLFETGADARCDAVAVVSAPSFVQHSRVLSRTGMSREKMASIMARQMPDAEKRRRADFVIRTGLGRAYALRQIEEIVRLVRCGAEYPAPPVRTRDGRQGKIGKT